ncbi:PRC-barrel domain-containing protein [Streptomyces sp. NPDC001691]|uniref:PRC-barrel domain-containing protein n=1 Tax=unclassified Streptomyces TaxID=2593676 RepID=UPI000DE97914|nr:PRC-barrel domain-containing protein [Streptomyces sp. SDr-06]RCH70013.1 PRC-barrel domain containing protein [Streptomyces sp. SDr-06]
MSHEIWDYRPTAGYRAGVDLVGYRVEATDGHIGKIDKHSEAVGAAYLVVDTGAWIFGRHVLLPVGTIERVDAAERTVHVDRTKDQVKDAPEYDAAKHAGEPSYLEQFARYYGQPRM